MENNNDFILLLFAATASELGKYLIQMIDNHMIQLVVKPKWIEIGGPPDILAQRCP